MGLARELRSKRKPWLMLAGFLCMETFVPFRLVHATQDRAQTQTQNMAEPESVFEVVSIKQNKNSSGMIRLGLWGERFLATGMTLQGLLQEAFGIEDDQLLGGPRWLKSESYDIEARVDATVKDKMQRLSYDQRQVKGRQMLQTVLADRFKLAFHWETKVLPVYALVPVKKGSQINQAKPGDTYPNGIKDLEGQGHADIIRFGRGLLIGQGVSITVLVRMLSQQQLGRHVLDKSGLTSKYDFTLQWTPDVTQGARLKALDGGEQPADSAASPETSGPSLFTAIQEQLGLKLQPEKDPVPILIIDHVERPSEN